MRPLFSQSAVALLALAAITVSLQAKVDNSTVTLDDVVIALPHLDGFPRLDGRDPALDQALSKMASSTENRMLALYGTENALGAVMKGDPPDLSECITIQVPLKPSLQNMNPAQFAAHKETFRKAMGKLGPAAQNFLKQIEDGSSEAFTKYHQVPSDVFFDDLALLGIFDETPSSISHSLLSKVRLATASGEEEKVQATSVSTVNIHDKLVSIYVYKVYETPADLQWTREKALNLAKLLLEADASPKATSSASSQDAKAQLAAGLKHLHGVGGPVNLTAAADLLLKAANQGDADAQFNYGMMLLKGDAMEADNGQALKWLNQAADQEHAAAQCAVGLLYLRGEGVERDLRKARDLLSASAAQGYSEAEYNLGLMFAKGDGGPKDKAKAMELLQRASSQGHARATDLLNGKIR